MKTLAIILLFVLLYFAVGAMIGYFAYLRPLANEAKTRSLSDDDLFVASTFGFLLIILFWPAVLLLVGISGAIDKAREFSASMQLCDYDDEDDENTDAL